MYQMSKTNFLRLLNATGAFKKKKKGMKMFVSYKLENVARDAIFCIHTHMIPSKILGYAI